MSFGQFTKIFGAFSAAYLSVNISRLSGNTTSSSSENALKFPFTQPDPPKAYLSITRTLGGEVGSAIFEIEQPRDALDTVVLLCIFDKLVARFRVFQPTELFTYRKKLGLILTNYGLQGLLFLYPLKVIAFRNADKYIHFI